MDAGYTYLLLVSCVVHIMVSATPEDWRSMKTDQLFQQLNGYQMIIPRSVDVNGDFIGYDVTSSSRRRKRQTVNDVSPESESSERMYYHASAYGRTFKFNVTSNRRLTSGSYQVEYWDQNGVTERHGRLNDCHYVGDVTTEQHGTSKAVISNCYGLHGFFSTPEGKFFIEPLWNHTGSRDEGHPHIIYRGSDIKNKHNHTTADGSCGIRDLTEFKNILNIKKHIQQADKQAGFHVKDKWRTRRRTKRSVSKEHFVETLIVADKSMVKYHGKMDIEAYILSIMNMVATLYHDESLGNAIHIVVSRIILLTEDQPTLEISHDADKSLDSFCNWQQKVNPSTSKTRRDKAVAHHDNAILLTRYDICTYKNEPCGTLGLAPVAGMCEEDRSCSINEDIGLASAFTVAHEMGHNFGMQHDGAGNSCGKAGHDSAKIMASQLTKNTDPFSWSSCSQEYITDFLDSGRGKCLENPPPQRAFDYPSNLPGEKHSADEQCALQYGRSSRACRKREVCSELWCTNDHGQCRTNSIPAVEGTPCSTHKVRSGWCYRGKCILKGYKPRTVDGGWGTWSTWGSCSRTCGGGVESSERSCSSPRPKHGGKYCLGERKRYRSCNLDDCPSSITNFREQQCTGYNDVPFRGKYYDWKPFNGGQVNPCAVNCLAVGYNFYTERAPKVIDGTSCYPDRHDMCINGECVSVGCDKILGSTAVEDRCRLCGGDGSSCEIIKGYVNDPLAAGTYQQLVMIPKGAIHIMIEEAVESPNNYLALKTKDGEYHINGGWTIDWPRNFEVVGTVFHYQREPGQPETLKALGPTTENMYIMLLLQEDNKGVMYQYNFPKAASAPIQPKAQAKAQAQVIFIWQYAPWSPCSSTCGNGMSKSVAVCVRKDDKTGVKDSYCKRGDRLSDLVRTCKDKACPAEWVLGDWSECSRTCGGGSKTRTAYCMRSIDDKEQEVVNSDKCPAHKPKTRATCNRDSCPAVWAAGSWSRCSAQCGAGTQQRNVYCRDVVKQRYLPYKSCDLRKRPPSRIRCNNGNCPPPEWKVGDWDKCSADCGEGQQRRSVQCKTYNGKLSNDCERRQRPHDIQACSSPCNDINKTKTGECLDVDTVAYCHLVLKFKICGRPYFRQLCCQTCSRIS